MKRFKHINAASVEEAASALETYGEKAQVIAGGTDILGQMKDNILPDFPGVLVNIKTIPGLEYIRRDGDTTVIGALTRLEDIARNDIVKRDYPALAEAARRTASPHIREQGTIAGNISQSNRCWYYWVPDNRFECIRKGGKRCFVYCGEGRYHSIFGSTGIQDSPCTAECPAQINIPGYMEKLREGDIDGAVRILLDSNPFPAITGRVCPHTCEGGCNRGEIDEPVSIRNVERFLGDYSVEYAERFFPAYEGAVKGKIAVIGSGPAGLSCAWYLNKTGYNVTVFEAMDQAGGMLTWGIPAYRLPKDIVKKQIDVLERAGITVITGARQTASDIRRLSGEYNAVFIASGAWKERELKIEGENLMISGTEFLRNRNLVPAPSGKKAAVIGGGNVAMDVSRTLLRMGVQPEIIYRRSQAEMPAVGEEIQKAEEEGVHLTFLTLPVAVAEHKGKIVLTCTKMKLGKPDSGGRPVAEPVEGSVFNSEYDFVIKATGEVPDMSFLPSEFINADGVIAAGDDGYIRENYFLGGDFLTGPSTVIRAIAAGRKSAGQITRFLGEQIQPDLNTNPRHLLTFDKEYLRSKERNPSNEIDAVQRLKNIDAEETTTFLREQVIDEARRCFNCGCLAVNSSDIAPALIVINAVIITNRRQIRAEDFFTVKKKGSTVLENEIITGICLPSVKPETRSSFAKFALRKSIDFPVVNCAACLEMNGDVITSARICLNAVYNTPYRAYEAERYLAGKILTEETAAHAGETAVQAACPLPDTTYKVQIAKTLVKRAILACLLINR
jgi:NADPH-dependent glutamate synthase beta subunit-like oxidoreductase